MPGRIRRLILASSTVCPVPAGAWAASRLPDARAAILADAGHMAHVDQPDDWLAALDAFLDDH
jgi:pimeloyl-ACP methyl ester carboxylesterase